MAIGENHRNLRVEFIPVNIKQMLIFLRKIAQIILKDLEILIIIHLDLLTNLLDYQRAFQH